MLEFKEFVDEMKKEVEKQFASNYDVKVNEVKKTNDIVLTGISVLPQDSKDKMNITPVVYLEPYYAKYEQGLSIAQVAHVLTDTISRELQYSQDAKRKLSESLSKDNIIVKLVGRDINEDRVRSLPHIDVEDMTKEYKLLIAADQDQTMTATVTFDLMNKLGIRSIEELDELAIKNTARLLPPVAKNMGEILFELGGEDIGMELESNSIVSMIVVSNEQRVNGANVILDAEFMQDIAMKEQDNLLIMPSFLHECILVKASDIDLEAAHQMVKEVNMREVETEDKLTDSVYIYDKDSRRIELAYNDMIRDVLSDVRKYGIESELLNMHSELNNNKAFMLQAIAINNECFEVCSDRLKNDNNILGVAISRNVERIINADNRDDRDWGIR